MRLCPAELLVIAGADAVPFAHAQFTSDVSALATGRWQWSAWLDAQGRVRHFFALMRVDPDRLLVWLPLGGAESMREALVRYVFRAKLTLTATMNWTLHALDAAESAVPSAAQDVLAHAGGFALRQPGDTDRIAWLAPAARTDADSPALQRWRAADIAAGLPLLAPELGGEFVPQALDLERLDAIRFDKGCYPGQEIAARLHFRGGNKRRLRRLRLPGAPAPIGAAVVDAGGANVGRVLYAAPGPAGTSDALAVVAVAATDDSALRIQPDADSEFTDV